MKNNAPRELPEVFVACAICSDMGHERNCYPPADIAWIGGEWMCAECWDATDEAEAGDADAFGRAAGACDFVRLAYPAPDTRVPQSESDYIASAVAALEG